MIFRDLGLSVELLWGFLKAGVKWEPATFELLGFGESRAEAVLRICSCRRGEGQLNSNARLAFADTELKR